MLLSFGFRDGENCSSKRVMIQNVVFVIETNWSQDSKAESMSTKVRDLCALEHLPSYP
jgi:hypothetical protein